jgi:glycosyltransferase involved in cell wall biosynthesis
MSKRNSQDIIINHHQVDIICGSSGSLEFLTVKDIEKKYIEIIEALYKNYDFTLITSNNEGTPYVLFESMSCGVPVISTNCGAVDEIIDNDITGVVIESRDPAKFAEKIISLYNDKIKYVSMSNESYNKYLSSYNMKIMVDKTLQFYKSILK